MNYGNDKFYYAVEKFILNIKRDGRLKELAIKNDLKPMVK
jgi:hypothetical protein